MIVPGGAETFSEGLRIGVETFHTLKELSHERGLSTAVGDEGGFAPDLESSEQAIEFDARGGRARRSSRPDRHRARPGDRPSSSARTASTASRAEQATAEQLTSFWSELVDRFPIVSIEDGARRGGLGRLEGADRAGSATGSSSSATTSSSRTSSACARGIDDGRRQFDPDQGQPDRDADRDARRRSRSGAARLLVRDLAPLRRDRGHDDRRPRRGHEQRPDQDRRPEPDRPDVEVQPAAADRRGTGV